jgi:hypothetical protein
MVQLSPPLSEWAPLSLPSLVISPKIWPPLLIKFLVERRIPADEEEEEDEEDEESDEVFSRKNFKLVLCASKKSP